jgi:hypothetical protein
VEESVGHGYTYTKQTSLKGDVKGAAWGPRVGESVGRGQQIRKATNTYRYRGTKRKLQKKAKD